VTAELRLRLEKRELVFPEGVAFCLVCGGVPAGKRRVWFEDLAAGAGAPGEIGSSGHALGAGARMMANRADFLAPLCKSHRRRAILIGLAANGFMLLAVGVGALGIYLQGLFKIPRRYEELVRWIAFIPILIPAGFGVYFWMKKDRGGLPCEVRREGGELVLTYPERAPG